MKIIIPMAGRGSRLRPHTLTTPKPLIKIAGKSIVKRLIEDISEVITEKITEIVYIIGDFGPEIEKDLHEIASEIGVKSHIYYQLKPLGTAHAIYCAKESLQGPIIVAFADTIFRANFKLQKDFECSIWTKKVADPTSFGVVVTNFKGEITDFKEKPEKFVSDKAIIGIYYFKESDKLNLDIEFLISNNIQKKGEFQLTDILSKMLKDGRKMSIENVDEWLDCGNPESCINTHNNILRNNKFKEDRKGFVIHNSKIIEPCYISNGVTIENSIIGPYVSIGKNSKIISSKINNSIIQDNTEIYEASFENSMIGNNVSYSGVGKTLNLGDFSNIK
tara:strand:+ start:8641 stop:9639 length:999 start_codon:yes stop_codon:yes gene_type:complete